MGITHKANCYRWNVADAGKVINDGTTENDKGETLWIGTVVCPHCLREITHTAFKENDKTCKLYAHNDQPGIRCAGSGMVVPAHVDDCVANHPDGI